MDPSFQLALFHYQTRSLEDFTRKLSTVLSTASLDYLNFCKENDFDPEDPKVLAEYERIVGIDQESDLCGSAVAARYWERAQGSD
jgi:hypothetical protein